MAQVLRQIAGGSQYIQPVLLINTLAQQATSNLPSMLQRNNKQTNKQYNDSVGREKNMISLTPNPHVTALLVLKDNVRKPNSVAWDTNNIQAMIVRCVPSKAMISPLLQMAFERKVASSIKNQTPQRAGQVRSNVGQNEPNAFS